MTVRLLPTENGDTYSGAGGKERKTQREGETQTGCESVFLMTGSSWRLEVFDAFVTFTECGHSRPVGGSAALVIEAGYPQLIGGVWFETCTVYIYICWHLHLKCFSFLLTASGHLSVIVNPKNIWPWLKQRTNLLHCGFVYCQRNRFQLVLQRRAEVQAVGAVGKVIVDVAHSWKKTERAGVWMKWQCMYLFSQSECKLFFLTMQRIHVYAPTHLSMIPLGARGSSQSSWMEREVRVTGRGGGWWAGGAVRVMSSLSGPWLQHWQMFKTETLFWYHKCISTVTRQIFFLRKKIHTQLVLSGILQ